MDIKTSTRKILKKIFHKDEFSNLRKNANKSKFRKIHIESFERSLQKSNVNPLISAAYPLFLLFIVLKKTNKVSDIDNLRNQLIEEVRKFESKALKSGYPARTVLAARYCLCSMLDEGILGTQWGQENLWSKRCLLSIIQKETWGGERFYIILEEMAKNLEENLDLLELLYLILTQGFEGKYYNNKFICSEIRSNLYQKLLTHREKLEKSNTLLVKPRNSDAKQKKRDTSFRSVVLIVLAFLFIITILTNYDLEKRSIPIFEELNKI